MNTKLTLNLDKDIIESAKDYAKQSYQPFKTDRKLSKFSNNKRR